MSFGFRIQSQPHFGENGVRLGYDWESSVGGVRTEGFAHSRIAALRAAVVEIERLMMLEDAEGLCGR